LIDFLIVGAGLYGSVCARELTDKGYSCLVIDKRPHIGGNCHTSKQHGIDVHTYGPHIFHTSNEEVWNYINRFSEFIPYKLSPIANYFGELYSLPFNLWTFYQIYGDHSVSGVSQKLSVFASNEEPRNLEEFAIQAVGEKMYRKLIHGYTKKQWQTDPKNLPADIIKRLPIRLTFDNNYFNDTYQGMPKDGYTAIFERMLDGIDVELGIDYFKERSALKSKKIIYTGKIDELFDYCYGDLDYRSLRFKQKTHNVSNYQGTAVMNYTDDVTPYTRVIEHKHFVPFIESSKTIVTQEYPAEYKRGVEPYYPINNTENNEKYKMYKELADKDPNLYLGGRLAEYKYYDMHQVIASALNFVNKI
jgi:UDP-galactopyranose mutase